MRILKKILLYTFLLVVVLAIVAVVAGHFMLDGAIKKAVETIGPEITKVDVKLDSVKLMLLTGTGKVNGLVVGNPTGFKTPSAIQVGAATLALDTASLLKDKIVIKSFNLQAPEITFETDLSKNNLKTILANVEETTGGGSKEPAAQSKDNKPAKKLQVDEFVIEGGKIHVSVTALAGQSATVPLPTIHLKDLGTGPDGITPAELTKKVLGAIVVETTKSAEAVIENMGKGAIYMSKEVGTNTIQKAAKGIGDLFQKKK